MKNTKLFSAILCGSMILAGCKNAFTGTEGSFDDAVKAKYNNSTDTVQISSGQSAVTISVSTPITWDYIDTDNNDKNDTYVLVLTASQSLKSASGFKMEKFREAADIDSPITFEAYPEASFALDPEKDVTGTKVYVSVKTGEGKEAPVDYLITVDASAIDTVTGAKLDADGDKFWGEAEDNAYFSDKITLVYGGYANYVSPIGYFVTPAATADIPALSASYDDEKAKLIYSATLDTDANKAVLDSYYASFEKYDAVNDTWVAADVTKEYTSVSDTAADVTPGEYKVLVNVARGIPVRYTTTDANKVVVNVNLDKKDIALPTTTNKYAVPAINQVVNANSTNTTSLSSIAAKYLKPDTDKLELSLSSEGNGVFYINASKFLPTEGKTWVADKDVTSKLTSITKIAGADKSSVKVYVKKTSTVTAISGESTKVVSYTEITPKEVSTPDNGSKLRIVLDDAELTATTNLVVTCSENVKVSGKGTTTKTGEAPVEGTFDNIAIGHTSVAKTTVTAKGWTAITNY
ncbi:MAG: hypothetical protein MJ185_03355 [Treponema sp.]|nr:hypothetical protein [Treponema sp.]